jgi:hypothetical protein
MRRYETILLMMLLFCLPAAAETVTVEASRDATLIEDPDGAWSNGSGPFFFAGRTAQAQNGVRRALLYFDLAAALPRNAIVESASLTLYISPSNPEIRELRLHRLLADWGEGPSSSSGGGGARSEPGDATWLHTFYDHEFWVHSGGQFLGRASARRDVGESGFYTWDSTNHMVQDVRLWKSAPQRNFGWVLIGDETTRQTAKSVASRENPDATVRPRLEVSYRLPGDAPPPAPPAGLRRIPDSRD